MPSQIDLDDLAPDEPVGGAKDKPSSARSKTSARTSEKKERELADRLVACFDRIAGALEQRGDEELADIIREDAGVMSQGLVYLTRPLTVLRAPLVGIIAIVEPVLAFGRVLRVSAERWADRRAMRAEQAQAEAEAQAAQVQ